MPEKKDRRTERTRRALMSAFVELMLSRGYAAVSVDAIAAQANVGRSTFYLHYDSKEALLKESLVRVSSGLADIVSGGVAPEALVPQLEHFHGQRRLNRVFFEGQARSIWVRCLAGLMEKRLAASRRHRAPTGLPFAFVALQLAEAQIALIAHWLIGRPGMRPLVIARLLVAATEAQATALLQT